MATDCGAQKNTTNTATTKHENVIQFQDIKPVITKKLGNKKKLLMTLTFRKLVAKIFDHIFKLIVN